MGLVRRSMDVDVLLSSVPLAAPDMQAAIAQVAAKHGRGPHWLNDDAKVVRDRLPPAYQPQTESIHGEAFVKLQIGIVTKAEFVITKLAIHEHIRQRDLRDIAELRLAEPDIAALWRRLDLIAGSDQVLALTIEAHFKGIRPEFAAGRDGIAIVTARGVRDYLLARYGFDAGAELLSEWAEHIEGHTRRAAAVVAQQDLAMARRLLSGDDRIAASDHAYRQAAPEAT
jgi:hypothetical protein